MDMFDCKILSLLQADASLPASAIGEQVGLSQSQCWRRIERLEADGVILRRSAIIDRRKVGLKMMLFAEVKLATHGRSMISDFTAAVEKFPEVLECHMLLGNIDALLRIVAASIEDYERFLFDKLSKLPMVREVNSMISVSEIKPFTGLPVSLFRPKDEGS